MPSRSRRYSIDPQILASFLPILPVRLCFALRESFQQGYGPKDFISDLMAGLVVGLVALPLSMALAIAVGAPPQSGLYTAIVAGFFAALLGGSRFQVTGPTAAFVVILVPVLEQHGFAGLLTAVFIAGLILVVMGFAGLGTLIQFIPHPVTTGFTSGIAVVIALIQLKDFFGLQLARSPETFIDRLYLMLEALPTFHFHEFAVGLVTLFILIGAPKLTSKVPAPLIALGTMSGVVYWINSFIQTSPITTIKSRFGGVPTGIPEFNWPWQQSLDGSVPHLSLIWVEGLLPAAFAIAILGAIESLLSAVVADGMGRTRHDPNTELVGQGVANLVSPLFGGIAATGALARTATNIRFGAKSPLASIIHALFIFIALVTMGELVSYLPMASLSALLLLVAYRMAEVKHFARMIRIAPKSDVFVLLICFGLTVWFDMVIGVTVGVVLAALLFMRRMAELTQAVQLVRAGKGSGLSVPPQVFYYEIAGPLFFGAARRAVDALERVENKQIRIVIFDLEDVPVMDVTGLVALESALLTLKSRNRVALLAGVQPQVLKLIERSELLEITGAKLIASGDEALQVSTELIKSS